MPFPETLEALESAGYKFVRSEVCPDCKENVEVFLSPGKREIQLNPMCTDLRPAVQHFKTCQVQYRTESNGASAEAGTSKPLPEVQQEPVGAKESRHPSLYGVTDPNHNLIAVGYDPAWDATGGRLWVQFSKGAGFHTGVPEDLFIKLRNSRFSLRQYQTTVKGKFPYIKVE